MEMEILSLPNAKQIKTEAPQEESLLESGVKEGAKFLGKRALNVAQTALGTIGDTAKFVGDVVNFPLKLAGVGVSDEEMKTIRKNSSGLPTSQELKDITHEYLPWTKEEPGSYGEDAERFVELLTAFSLPGGVGKALGAIGEGAKATNVAKSALSGISSAAKNNIGKLVGAETAGWLTQELTGDKNSGDLVRMGTLVGLQLKGTRDLVRKQASEGYNTAKELAKGAERTHAHGFQNTVHEWLSDLNKGDKDAGFKVWAKSKIDQIHDTVKSGKFGVNDAVQWVQDIRDDLRKGKVPYKAQNYAYKIINELKDQVINPYKKVNTKFADIFDASEQAWSALHKESAFTNFIRENFVDKPWVSKIGGHLFGGALSAGLHKGGLAKAIPWVGGALAGRDAYRFVKLIKDSSIARNTFYNLIKQTTAGNVAAASKLAVRFDKEAAKYESEQDNNSEEITLEHLPK